MKEFLRKKDQHIRQRRKGLKKDKKQVFKFDSSKQKYKRNIYADLKVNTSPSDIIKYAFNTEKAVSNIQNLNKLVLACDLNSTKPLIKEAVEKKYNVKVSSVNTLNMMRLNVKKAYITLAEPGQAIATATEFGIL